MFPVSGPWTILAANTTMAMHSPTFFISRARFCKWALDHLCFLAANLYDDAVVRRLSLSDRAVVLCFCGWALDYPYFRFITTMAL